MVVWAESDKEHVNFITRNATLLQVVLIYNKEAVINGLVTCSQLVLDV